MKASLRAVLLLALFVGCQPATPWQPPSDLPANALDNDAFGAAINLKRAQTTVCNYQPVGNPIYPIGSTSLGPAKPITWNAKLELAARVQAWDLLQRETVSHVGKDGSDAALRTRRAGYTANAVVGETIVAGSVASNEAALGLWLTSETGHCNAVMDDDFSEFGAAKLEAPAGSKYETYWVLVLGHPK